MAVIVLSTFPSLCSIIQRNLSNANICEGESFELGGQSFETEGTYTVTVDNGLCNTIFNLTLSVTPNSNTLLTQIICEGETISVGTAVYSTTGIFNNILISENGCDSLVTLDLTVNDNTTTDLTESICEGESFQLGNTTYFTVNNGICNTIFNLNLSVTPNSNTLLTQTICEGETISVGTAVYSTTGIFNNILISENGCDSLVTLDLTVNENTTTDLIESICEGESFQLGNNTYSETGNYSEILIRENGCDSILNLSLTVLDNSEQFINANICDGETFELGGQSFDSAGTYNFTVNNGLCNTIFNLNLSVTPNSNTLLTQTICEGETISVGTAVYSTTGIFDNILINENGCDSLVTLDLTVNENTSTDLTESICVGESFQLGNTTYSETGNYSEILIGENGCDSIVNLSLTVLDDSEQFITANICDGETYELGGQSFDTADTYNFTVNNGICNTIFNLNLSVTPNSNTLLTQTICEGETISVGTAVYSTTGIFNNILISENGCDSLVTLDLTVNENTTTDLIESICEGESFQLGNNTYSETGNYSEILIRENGCDSILNLSLTVLDNSEQFINANICDGETFELGGQSFDSAGTYNFTVNNGLCNTIFNLNLSVTPNSNTLLTQTICEGETISVGTAVYSTTGIFDNILINENGCDSLVTLDLTVNENTSTDLTESICVGESFQLGNTTYSETGNYSEILIGENGCDSIVNLSLTVLDDSEQFITANICDGETYELGGQSFDTADTYNFTVNNGICNTIFNLNLSVTPNSNTLLTQTICEGETISVGTAVYSTTGIFNNILISENGCDSLVTLDLTVNENTTTDLIESICEGESFQLGNNTYSETGNYSEILIRENGCDSILNLSLTVLDNSEQFINANICDGETFELGGQSFDSAGTYNFTVNNGLCNTIFNLNLSVTPNSNTLLTQTICEGESVSVGTAVYSTTGIFNNILISENGCDSLVTLDLTVNDNTRPPTSPNPFVKASLSNSEIPLIPKRGIILKS